MAAVWEPSEAPAGGAPLAGAAGCEFGGAVYVLGGFAAAEGSPADEIRHSVYDASAGRWLSTSEVDIDGDVPTPRAGCSVTRVFSTLYLFGGKQTWPVAELNDFYAGSIVQPGVVQWECLQKNTEMEVAAGPTKAELAKAGAEAAAAARAAMVDPETGDPVEGPEADAEAAAAASTAMEDLKLAAARGVREPTEPPHRSWHGAASMVEPGGLPVVVLCGGASTGGNAANNGGLLADLWIFDTQGREWKQQKGGMSGASPLPRAHHTLTPVGDGTTAVLFGGKTPGSSFTNDVFVLDAGRWNWSEFKPSAPTLGPGGVAFSGPPATSWHGATAARLPMTMLAASYGPNETYAGLKDSREEAAAAAAAAAAALEAAEEDGAEGGEGGDEAGDGDEGDGDEPEAEGAVTKAPAAVVKSAGRYWNRPKGDDDDGTEVLLIFGGAGKANAAGDAPADALYALDRCGRWHCFVAEFGTSSPAPAGMRFNHSFVAVDDLQSVFLAGGADPVNGMSAATLKLWAEPPPQESGEDGGADGLGGKSGPRTVKQQLADGGSYEGFLNAAGQRHGQGKLVYANGDVYEGSWELDVRSGEGTMQYADGSCYTGSWERDMACGQGKMTFSPSAEMPLSPSKTLRGGDSQPPQRAVAAYEGSWDNGERHGAGTITYCDGSTLEGAWEAGALSNPETATVTDGVSGAVVTNADFRGDVLLRGTETAPSEDGGIGTDTFVGAFNTNGQRHGKGMCTFQDGSTYEGEWRCGRRNGKGVFRDARTKEVYDGKWVAGKRCGRGLCTYPAGHRYEGQWAEDLRDGEGTFFRANGEKYSGAWSAGERHGHGVHTDTRGRVKAGNWRNGQIFDSEETKDSAKGGDDNASLDGPSIADGASVDWNADGAL
jgi:hypothetical protein